MPVESWRCRPGPGARVLELPYLVDQTRARVAEVRAVARHPWARALRGRQRQRLATCCSRSISARLRSSRSKNRLMPDQHLFCRGLPAPSRRWALQV